MKMYLAGGFLRSIGIVVTPLVMLTNAATGNEFSREGHLATVLVAGVVYAAGWLLQRVTLPEAPVEPHQVSRADQQG